MLRIEWINGDSDVATKMIEFCTTSLLITSVKAETVARLLLEINNNAIGNNHMLRVTEGKKIASARDYQNLFQKQHPKMKRRIHLLFFKEKFRREIKHTCSLYLHLMIIVLQGAL